MAHRVGSDTCVVWHVKMGASALCDLCINKFENIHLVQIYLWINHWLCDLLVTTQPLFNPLNYALFRNNHTKKFQFKLLLLKDCEECPYGERAVLYSRRGKYESLPNQGENFNEIWLLIHWSEESCQFEFHNSRS